MTKYVYKIAEVFTNYTYYDRETGKRVYEDCLDFPHYTVYVSDQDGRYVEEAENFGSLEEAEQYIKDNPIEG